MVIPVLLNLFGAERSTRQRLLDILQTLKTKERAGGYDRIRKAITQIGHYIYIHIYVMQEIGDAHTAHVTSN